MKYASPTLWVSLWLPATSDHQRGWNTCVMTCAACWTGEKSVNTTFIAGGDSKAPTQPVKGSIRGTAQSAAILRLFRVLPSRSKVWWYFNIQILLPFSLLENVYDVSLFLLLSLSTVSILTCSPELISILKALKIYCCSETGLMAMSLSTTRVQLDNA